MALVSVGDAEIYCEVHGSGPPLLLAAGLGGAGTYWKEQVEALAARFRVVVYDQRGTGRSTHVPVASIEQLAQDALALLDALGLETVHFVGHSTGAAIGQVLAIEHSERLASLVLYATVDRSDPFRERMWGLRKAILKEMGPRAYARMTSLVLYPPWWIADNDRRLALEEATAEKMLSRPEIMGSRIEAILAFDRAAELGRITTPTLVVCARDDMMTPAYFSERIAAAILGARLEIFERGGHACSKTIPETFNRLVIDFASAHS
jgi:aminoacrylate hydrolase